MKVMKCVSKLFNWIGKSPMLSVNHFNPNAFHLYLFRLVELFLNLHPKCVYPHFEVVGYPKALGSSPKV